MPKITKRSVGAVSPDPIRDVVIWDDALPGFGMRVKSFIVQYRTENGRSCRLTVGRFGVLMPEDARNDARQLLAAAARGLDPADQKSAARDAWTVKELCEEYFMQSSLG